MLGIQNNNGEEINVTDGLQDGSGRIEVELGGVPEKDFNVQLNTEWSRYYSYNFSSSFDTDKQALNRTVHITVDTVNKMWIFECNAICTLRALYSDLQFTPRNIWSVYSVQYKDNDRQQVTSVTIFVNGSERLDFYP